MSKYIRHNEYANCLFEEETTNATFRNIRSIKHQLRAHKLNGAVKYLRIIWNSKIQRVQVHPLHLPASAHAHCHIPQIHSQQYTAVRSNYYKLVCLSSHHYFTSTIRFSNCESNAKNTKQMSVTILPCYLVWPEF